MRHIYNYQSSIILLLAHKSETRSSIRSLVGGVYAPLYWHRSGGVDEVCLPCSSFVNILDKT
jgi:hypothetical protein